MVCRHVTCENDPGVLRSCIIAIRGIMTIDDAVMHQPSWLAQLGYL